MEMQFLDVEVERNAGVHARRSEAMASAVFPGDPSPLNSG